MFCKGNLVACCFTPLNFSTTVLIECNFHENERRLFIFDVVSVFPFLQMVLLSK